MKQEINERAKSTAQRKFMGMVDAYKKGDMPDASPAIKKAAKSMTSKQVKDFAKTKHKGLPEHVDESCDGKHPYCGEKNDMEKIEKKAVENDPINFTKKQKSFKINETQLRQIIRESLQELMTNDNSTYTMDDWRRDGTLKVKEGQLISPDVYWQLLGSVPPMINGKIFQPGEAYDYDWEHNTLLYQTFKREGEDLYRYIGLRPAGQSDTINESRLRHLVRETLLNELSIDTIDNARQVATKKAMAADYGTPERVRRNAQANNFKQTRDQRLGFNPEQMSATMRQSGTSGDETVDRRWARYTQDAENRRLGKRVFDKEKGRWTNLAESVHTALIKTLGEYTQGKASSEQANKAIMDLANSSNKKEVNEERKSLNFPEYAEEYMKKNGKKLPDDVLNTGNKKWSDRFHDNKPDGKYCYVPLKKKINETE